MKLNYMTSEMQEAQAALAKKHAQLSVFEERTAAAEAELAEKAAALEASEAALAAACGRERGLAGRLAATLRPPGHQARTATERREAMLGRVQARAARAGARPASGRQ